ncbi:MAG: hypothetical protein QXX08_02960 [Candidatus Bathyarchaeia archaeon]
MAVLSFFIPIIQVVQETTYMTWFPDGQVQTRTQQITVWISPLQYIIQGGRIYCEVKTLDDLRQILEKIRFKEEYRPKGGKELPCGEKTAILMKYLKEKGFIVEMARGELQLDDEKIPHAWVIVHLKEGTYVIETNMESGCPDIIGKVEEAAKDSPSYLEKERWDVEKIEKKYEDLLKEKPSKYLEEA